MPFPVEERYILAAEEALGARFPDSFRQKVLEDERGELPIAMMLAGWYLLPFFDQSFSDVVRETAAMQHPSFPAGAVVFAADSTVNKLVFLRHPKDPTSLGPAVHFWGHEGELREVAGDFSELLERPGQRAPRDRKLVRPRSFAGHFRWWTYTVGHSVLLLRRTRRVASDPPEAPSTRVDILFKPVSWMCMPQSLNDIRVEPLSSLEAAEVLQRHGNPVAVEKWESKLYRLTGSDGVGYIAAGVCAWHEADLDYDAPCVWAYWS